MARFTAEADNREGIMRGSMTLAEIELACRQARALGCTDDTVPTTTNEAVVSIYGGPIVQLSFELPAPTRHPPGTAAGTTMTVDRPALEAGS